MRWRSPERKPINWEAWNLFFALYPRRIGDQKVWLEIAERRLVVDSEGNWAGGYRCHWEYRFQSKTEATA